MQIAVLEMTVRKPSFDNFNNANTEYTAAYLGLISFFDREFERDSITFKFVDKTTVDNDVCVVFMSMTWIGCA